MSNRLEGSGRLQRTLDPPSRRLLCRLLRMRALSGVTLSTFSGTGLPSPQPSPMREREKRHAGFRVRPTAPIPRLPLFAWEREWRLAFPAGAQRRGRGSPHTRRAMDPLPGFRPPGVTPSASWPSPDLIRGSVPAIPIKKSAAPHSIEITGTRPVEMTRRQSDYSRTCAARHEAWQFSSRNARSYP